MEKTGLTYPYFGRVQKLRNIDTLKRTWNFREKIQKPLCRYSRVKKNISACTAVIINRDGNWRLNIVGRMNQ